MRGKSHRRRTGDTSDVFRPHYDHDLRELWLGRRLVKRFTQRAPDQHLILCAFEEQNWPARIDSPLFPRRCGEDRKRRLNHAIYRLNRHQHARLIRFRGDGTGDGVIWQLRRPKRSKPSSGESGDSAEVERRLKHRESSSTVS